MLQCAQSQLLEDTPVNLLGNLDIRSSPWTKVSRNRPPGMRAGAVKKTLRRATKEGSRSESKFQRLRTVDV